MNAAQSDNSAARAPRTIVLITLGISLFAAALAVGSKHLSAPWVQGDEYLFIVKNSDVTGQGRDESLLLRCMQAFTTVHYDLYQPLPIVTYAIEWKLWGERRVEFIRTTDVLLHGLNAVLLWFVLMRLLGTFASVTRSGIALLSWALALLWLAHPTLAGAYAADMGRTHLLSATFALTSLLLHLRALRTGRQVWFAPALLALLAAMLSKVVVGWIVLVVAIEILHAGWRAALRSYRVYCVAAVCVAFAVLTLKTSGSAGIFKDIGAALFGDPLSRGFLAAFLSLKDIVWPFGLATWYVPDVDTGFRYPPVWIGLALIIGSLAIAAACLRTRSLPLAGVGVLWYWAMISPTLGFVGARFAAAQDRYLYQPLMGLMLALGCIVCAIQRSGRLPNNPRFTYAAATVLALIALALAPAARELAATARDTVKRAEVVVSADVNDPRAREMLAAANEFAAEHPPADAGADYVQTHYENAHDTFIQAAEMASANPRYFRDDAAIADFIRRISTQLQGLDDPQQSLRWALRLRDFAPDAPRTWTRIARAHRELNQPREALAAYQRLERVAPEDAHFRAVLNVEIADLLLFTFNNPAAARPRYADALSAAVLPHGARLVAMTGLARCEVLAGEGAEGYRLAAQVLSEQGNNLSAALVVGLYHVRSHHWEAAYDAFTQILAAAPAEYEALRGFQVACQELGRWSEAAFKWQGALRADPDHPAFRPYFVWAAACARDESAERFADALLAERPGNRFACLAKMLLAIRAGELDAASEWITKAAAGAAIPLAREFARAARALELMIERSEIDSRAAVPCAELWLQVGAADRARAVLDRFLTGEVSAADRARAGALIETMPPKP